MKYILTLERPKLEPQFGDYVEYTFLYSIVESHHLNQPDEKLYTLKQSVIVRVSNSLCRIWGLSDRDLIKVLFEFGKRRLIQNIQNRIFLPLEKLNLDTSVDSIVPCPYDPARITEPDGYTFEVLIEEIPHTQINTSGGAYVQENVYAGQDFIGRDKIEHHWHIYHTSDTLEKHKRIAEEALNRIRHEKRNFEYLVAGHDYKNTAHKKAVTESAFELTEQVVLRLKEIPEFGQSASDLLGCLQNKDAARVLDAMLGLENRLATYCGK